MQETRQMRVWSLGQEDPMEKEMATHFSTLAWRIPWTEEPGGLQSMALQRVGHNWSDSAAAAVGGAVDKYPLPMQGTWVWFLVQEDSTCLRATKPVYHSYWARALEPESRNCWARVLQLLKAAHQEPVLPNKRSLSSSVKSGSRLLQLEKARAQRQRLAQPINTW